MLIFPVELFFSCLSHDIIAHEVTHAILDGMHRRYIEPVHPDNLAFHEAFSDIVALFQHFTFPEVLRSQIAKTKGDLSTDNLLGQLAQQFGIAIGNYGSLRNALGSTDEKTQKWKRKRPDSSDYLTIMEPHDRGSILVGAIFDAFISIYDRRSRDLFRIATNGTGILPEGELHPDLVNRLSSEACKSAQHVLDMCIRALDYCPPNEVTFGDFLRAIITVDYDLVPDDDKKYRLAFIEAFKARGIYPSHVRSLSEESLRWKTPGELSYLGASSGYDQKGFKMFSDAIHNFKFEKDYLENRREAHTYMEQFRRELHGPDQSQTHDVFLV